MGRKKTLPNRADRILEAASTLFAEFSYEKTTLDEIALQAGISKGSIYLEFASKEEILFAIIQRSKDIQLMDMQRIAARESSSALDSLKLMLVCNIGAIYDSVKRNRRSPEEVIQSRERLRTHLKPFFDSRLQLIEDLLHRAAAHGEIQPRTDFHRVAHLIMQTLRGVMPPYLNQPGKLTLQNEANEILELVLNGLR